jgi:hypothetical protein
MAHPTGDELREAVGLVAGRMGYGKLHERLVRLNAFVSRRKPPTPDALADRLYSLTGGLRRNVPATIAFHTVWAENVTQGIPDEDDKKLSEIADRINATLTENERAVKDDQTAELDDALGEYERILAAAIGAKEARLEMLFKAVPPVADRLRGKPLAEAPAAAPAGEEA